MKVTGRTILITGGSAGIGLAFALKFLELGNEVIITGRRQDALDAAKIRAPKLHTIQSDVADPDQVLLLAEQVSADFPHLDVLFNNAGILAAHNLTAPTVDFAHLLREMDVNVSGTICTTASLIDKITKNRGTIINVSSALAFAPVPALPIYCATKAAVHSYTQSLRFQLEETGVEVIELMPPTIKTDLGSEFSEAGFKTLTTDELLKKTFAAFKAGKKEIRPGQSNLVALMCRLAPGLINRQFWKASQGLMPAPPRM